MHLVARIPQQLESWWSVSRSQYRRSVSYKFRRLLVRASRQIVRWTKSIKWTSLLDHAENAVHRQLGRWTRGRPCPVVGKDYHCRSLNHINVGQLFIEYEPGQVDQREAMLNSPVRMDSC